MFYVDAIDCDGALDSVVETRDEVDEGGFARARLSDKGDGLAFVDSEVDIAENPIVLVFERYVVETDCVIERVDRLRIARFDNSVLCVENSVDALERSHTFLDAISSARELFERVEYGVENDEIVYKFRRRDATIAVEDEVATIPKENGDDGSAKKFADRMSKEIARVDAIESEANGVVERLKTISEFFFGIEGLDDA